MTRKLDQTLLTGIADTIRSLAARAVRGAAREAFPVGGLDSFGPPGGSAPAASRFDGDYHDAPEHRADGVVAARRGPGRRLRAAVLPPGVRLRALPHRPRPAQEPGVRPARRDRAQPRRLAAAHAGQR